MTIILKTCCLASFAIQAGASTFSRTDNVTKSSVELIDGDVYDIPLDRAQHDAEALGLSVMEIAQGFEPEIHRVASNLPNARQQKIWDLVADFDAYRTSALWEE